MLAGLAGSFSNRMLAGYGTAALAAMAAADKATMVVRPGADGDLYGRPAAAGLQCGGPQPAAAARGADPAGRADLRVWGCLCSRCLLGQNTLLGLFLSDAEALALGRQLLPWLLAASPLLGIYYLSTNFLQAAGRAAGATVLSALRRGCC